MRTNKTSYEYIEFGSRIELSVALATLTGHIILEIWTQGLQGAADSFGAVQHGYNVFIALPWGVYLTWRYFQTPSALKAWGITKRGFRKSLLTSLWLAVPAIFFLTVWGWKAGNLPPPLGFWLLLWLYPIYGTAQQFALQGLVTRNLRSFSNSRLLRASVTGVIFSLAHIPNFILAVLA